MNKDNSLTKRLLTLIAISSYRELIGKTTIVLQRLAILAENTKESLGGTSENIYVIL